MIVLDGLLLEGDTNRTYTTYRTYTRIWKHFCRTFGTAYGLS